jgi:hypothetical protein
VAEALGEAGAAMSRQFAASQLAVGSRQGRWLHCLLRTAYCLLFFVTSAAFAADTLPFIEDDYAKAVARAKTKNVPIFVEAWAPW